MTKGLHSKLIGFLILLALPNSVQAIVKTNYYTIDGISNGVGWSVAILEETEGFVELECGPIPIGGTPAQFAAEFVSCLNGMALWTGSAMIDPTNANGFCVTSIVGDFGLSVGITNTVPLDVVGCDGQSFNANVFLVCDVPAVSTWGFIVMTLLCMSTGTVIIRRFS